MKAINRTIDVISGTALVLLSLMLMFGIPQF